MVLIGAVLAAWLAGEYEVEALKEAPPKEVAEAVRKAMASEGARIVSKGDRKPFADVWLRASLPQENAPEQLVVKYTAFKPGALVGVIRYHAKGGDFKNQSIPAGIYTLRYGVQPEDGDHQGVSETKDFLMLSPVAADTSAEAVALEELLKLSAKVTGKKHPVVLWLLKTGKEGDKLPKVTREEQGDRWIFEAEIPSPAKDQRPLRLGLVVVGKSPDF